MQDDHALNSPVDGAMGRRGRRGSIPAPPFDGGAGRASAGNNALADGSPDGVAHGCSDTGADRCAHCCADALANHGTHCDADGGSQPRAHDGADASSDAAPVHGRLARLR